MFYRLLHLLMSVTLRLYFRRIESGGLRVLENDRPTLIIANHTSAFMDPMLLGMLLRRRIHFFVRGDVFKHKLAARLFRSLGMMPIFRRSEGLENMHRNEDTNNEALQVLAGGGAVLIFAEGFSDIAKMTKPLKKGPFRLAAQALDELGEAPLLVPVGINYMRQEKPGYDAWIQAGTPIDSSLFLKSGDDDETRKRAILQLLRITEEGLAAVAFNAADAEGSARADLMLMQAQRHAPDNRLSFRQAKEVVAAAVTTFSGQGNNKMTRRPGRPGFIVLIWMSFVPALAGWLFHLVPLRLAASITRKTVSSPDFTASILATVSMVLVALWYLLVFIIAACLRGWKASLLLPVAAACGLVANRIIFLLRNR